jgi:hypothetical protein
MHLHESFQCNCRVEGLVQESLTARHLLSSSCKKHGEYPPQAVLCICTFFGVSQGQAWQQCIVKGVAALLRCKSILILVISHPWSFDCG